MECTVFDCNSRAVVSLHVTTKEDRLKSYDFPYCGGHVGEYHVKLRENELFLVEVRDIL